MRCDRCNRLCQDNPASVPRLTEVTIKGRRAVFCDECGENVSTIHEVTDPKVVAIAGHFVEESVWVHKGGGYYENRETGETRRGRPEEGEGDEGDEGEAKPDNADAEFTPKEEASAAAESESGLGES